jgi:hypothetical protein
MNNSIVAGGLDGALSLSLSLSLAHLGLLFFSVDGLLLLKTLSVSCDCDTGRLIAPACAPRAG